MNAPHPPIPAAPRPAAAAPQVREQTDPSERIQPIPLAAAAITLAMVLTGALYIVVSEPFGFSQFGDRRTLADLRAATASGKVDGKQVFNANCVACHQATGQGLPGVFPPLAGSEWAQGNERVVANILLHGIDGEITVAGKPFKGAMPSFKRLGDAELAAVASYIRSDWSNKAPPIPPAVFAAERQASARTTPFQGEAELKALR